MLAIETATPLGGIALVSRDAMVLGDMRWRRGRTHSESIAESIRILADLTGTDLGELSGVSVSIGPGSFTGLRIGLALAKGLCFGTDIPLIPVSTLTALAANAGTGEHPVRVILNARTDEVYTALFAPGARTGPRRLGRDEALHPERALDRVKEPTVLTGDWVLENRVKIRRRVGSLALFPAEDRMVPCPVQVGLLGLRRLRRGRLKDPASISPAYVAPSQAEVKWKRRNRQNS